MKMYVRSDEDNAAIEVMKRNEFVQSDPLVGLFWWDKCKKELFGVRSTPEQDVPFYKSKQWNSEVKTDRRLHKDVWNKESHRGRDRRFLGNYMLVPRGRIFEFRDMGFVVYTGSWIDDEPEAKEEILQEFQLPNETEFRKDRHWDIGHGWSDEF